MSTEDRKALAIMEGSIKKVNGHQQIALPWRDDNPNLPQNRLMAETRLHGLQRKLLSDSDLCEKYCGKIGEYIASGYASPVPQNAPVTPGKTFCVPHFSTSVLTKFRVVFDCSAKFDGVSLNDKLLQGQDLVTGLLGVLMRFGQETIAVVADIKACFHQVFVAEEDRDAFRFLWFDKNDPKQPPVDYRVNVHIFRAASSPSVTAFALRRTALANDVDASSEAVLKNIYVDDLGRVLCWCARGHKPHSTASPTVGQWRVSFNQISL